MLDAEWFDENQMNVSAVPSAEPCDSQRRLHARPGSQTGGQDPLSKFASLLDPACLVPTWTGLAEVAQPIEHVPAPASGAATRPSNIVPPRGPKETHDNPIETAARHSGVAPTQSAHRLEPPRRSRRWKPKAFALASLFLVGAAVALSSRDYIHGLAETYRSMLLDAIAGLDDAATQRATAMPERAAQPPSEDTLSALRATQVAGNAQSARDSADRSEEEALGAGPSAGTVARTLGATAPAGISARASAKTAAESATPSTASAVPVTDNAQSAHPAAESSEEEALGAGPSAGTVARRLGATAPADISARASAKTAAESATPSIASAVPAMDVGQSTHPAAESYESYEEQAVNASPPTATVAPPPAPNAPADGEAANMPLAPRPAVAPVRVGPTIPEPKPDRTPISFAIGSSETSSAAAALKLPAKRASEETEGSAGIAPASDPSSDLPNTLKAKPGVAAIPNDVAQMPSLVSQPGNRHKREKSEKSANALKVIAAESDTDASAIQFKIPRVRPGTRHDRPCGATLTERGVLDGSQAAELRIIPPNGHSKTAILAALPCDAGDGRGRHRARAEWTVGTPSPRKALLSIPAIAGSGSRI